MCDNDFVMCDVPKASMEMVVVAWNDFKRDPGDHNKFDAFDLVIRTVMAQWENYADGRRVSAAKKWRP